MILNDLFIKDRRWIGWTVLILLQRFEGHRYDCEIFGLIVNSIRRSRVSVSYILLLSKFLFYEMLRYAVEHGYNLSEREISSKNEKKQYNVLKSDLMYKFLFTDKPLIHSISGITQS